MLLMTRSVSELPAGELVFREWYAEAWRAWLSVSVLATCISSLTSLMTLFVTPKGVQPPAVCDASATREGL